MLKHFCIYGFLKNQRYFDLFLVLAFREKGFSFAQIGFLIAFRELSVNLMELPSGAAADVFGRRRCMIISFIAYIASFALFAVFNAYWFFYIPMFLFAIGDAFRTGTHKAMIFTWLRMQNRIEEKTKIYGFTRSWSKIGSAISGIIAPILVIVFNNYNCVFYITIVPYLLGLINFAFYPSELDGRISDKLSLGKVVKRLVTSLKNAIKDKPLRRILIESMAYEGQFVASKDYVQPIIKNAAVALPFFMGLDATRRSAVLIGAVYFVLHLVSAYASRKSHRVVEATGSEDKAILRIWILTAVFYAALIPLLFFKITSVAIIIFVLLYLSQNIFRPCQVSRFAEHSSEDEQATVLSIESQAKSGATMILAPAIGFAVDMASKLHNTGNFWPIGAVGLLIALVILVTTPRRSEPEMAQSPVE